MGSYTAPDLPFATGALEPFADARAVELHHEIHQRHVAKLNETLERTDELRSLSEQPIEDLLWNFGKVPQEARTAVRNFGGGHANHSVLWETLSPDGGGEPTGDIAEAIRDEFGSFQALQTAFGNVAANHFGSGWAWLIRTRSRLLVYSLPNEDSPLTAEEMPILGLDLWEHAYHDRFGLDVAGYVDAFWQVVDWESVNNRYLSAVRHGE